MRKRLAAARLAAAVVAMTAGLSGTSTDARARERPLPVSHGPDAVTPAFESRPLARAAASWCGSGEVRRARGGPHRFRAVYLVPGDAPDRFHSLAPAIEADALAASRLIEDLYGRALRFAKGTSCGAQHLDIARVRTAIPTERFAAVAHTASETLRLVADALAGEGLAVRRASDSARAARRRRENWVVWLDAPAPAGACGAAEFFRDGRRTRANWNNTGGGVAVLYAPGGTFCGPAAVRHEIAHVLGAVMAAAPNSVGDGHCADAAGDTMCAAGSPSRPGGEFFDFGNDDYWDPPGGAPLGWWTLNLSRFVTRVGGG